MVDDSRVMLEGPGNKSKYYYKMTLGYYAPNINNNNNNKNDKIDVWCSDK